MEIHRIHFTKIYSTNTWALQNSLLLPQNTLTLITADEQTMGRGRQQRSWISPPNKNIYASFCAFVDKNRTDISNISQVVSLSICRVLEAAGFNPRIKWPNDILLHEKKVSGVLCETKEVENKRLLVVGIGLNVNMSQNELDGIDKPATSLKVERGAPVDKSSLLTELERTFADDLQLFIKNGFPPFLDDYKSRMEFDRDIEFHDNLNLMKGRLKTINDDGSISFQLESGEIKKFSSGEILSYL